MIEKRNPLFSGRFWLNLRFNLDEIKKISNYSLLLFKNCFENENTWRLYVISCFLHLIWNCFKSEMFVNHVNQLWQHIFQLIKHSCLNINQSEIFSNLFSFSFYLMFVLNQFTFESESWCRYFLFKVKYDMIICVL